MSESLLPTAPCVMDENCLLRRTLDLIADRWTPTVLFVLSYGPRRYSELQRSIPDLSKKMLTQTLHEGVRNGLLSRSEDAAGPGRALYTVSPLGRQVLEPILGIATWATQNVATLDAVSEHRKHSLKSAS
jgi:DNA-binding HxlR family transcriptional regulator